MSGWIGKCRAGHAVRAAEQAGGWLRCSCGRDAVARGFVAKVSGRRCGEVCQGASGPSCSCECGGENHGAGAAFTPPD